ncbi:mitochondrial phosphate carrier protein 2 [Nannochloropsis oceanica]
MEDSEGDEGDEMDNGKKKKGSNRNTSKSSKNRSSYKTKTKKKKGATVSSSGRRGTNSYSRDALIGVLGVTLLTGLAIGTSKPDMSSLLPSSTPPSLPFSSSTTGASPLAGASTSSFLGDSANRKGYLGWRRLSEVENRAKDQNKAQKTYPVRFVTYLTRFLVNFDEDDKALWAKLAKDIPFTYKEAEVEATRRRQFAAIADSAEIGLYDYQGPEGVQRLFDLLKDRYGQTSTARRQLAILFSFLEESQPVQGIARMLIDTDNARVAAFRLITGGDGYTSKTPPKVTITSPMMPTPQPARAQAVVKDTGSVRRLQLTAPGSIYTHGVPPEVVISEPPKGPESRRAKAIAVLEDESGKELGRGRVKEVVLTDPGSGYRSDYPIKVAFIAQGPGEAEEQLRLESSSSSSSHSREEGGGAAAVAVLDKEVVAVELLDGGAGYTVPLGAEVSIAPPAEKDGRQAYAKAVVRPTVTRIEAPRDYNPTSLSAQLQQLLPSDTVLEFDVIRQVFVVRGEPEDDLMMYRPEENTFYDPIFGPVGRSPIEMERELTFENYVRLALSGGCCISIVRTSLQPLEILKTRLQAQPELYPGGWLEGIEKIREEGGNAFYKAWDCTSLAGFLLGMLGFGFNEFFRRALTDIIGTGSAEVFEIPIILGASALSTIITCLLTCPLEAVRIRIMSSSPSLASAPFTSPSSPFSGLGSFLAVGNDMMAATGIKGLYDGLGPLLFREVPFIMTKFLVFEIVRGSLFSLFPAANEAPNLSLVVSFLAGIAAGVAGAFTGCPADAVLTRLNAQEKETDWRAMVKVMLAEPGGWKNLFAGVDIRVVFFALLIGIQFFLYDWFKELFGVAADDLTLVLDVFGRMGGEIVEGIEGIEF